MAWLAPTSIGVLSVAVAPKPLTTNICPTFWATVMWLSVHSTQAVSSAAVAVQGDVTAGTDRPPTWAAWPVWVGGAVWADAAPANDTGPANENRAADAAVSTRAAAPTPRGRRRARWAWGWWRWVRGPARSFTACSFVPSRSASQHRGAPGPDVTGPRRRPPGSPTRPPAAGRRRRGTVGPGAG